MNTAFSGNHHKETDIMQQFLAEGDTMGFMKHFGRAYSLEGEVVEGNRIGRTLGYPTANLQLGEARTEIPDQGVYTAMVYVEDSWYAAMANIGIRPTLDLEHVTVEAHLFDFSGNLYGKHMAIHFLQRIRDEMRFSSLSELKDQLDHDKERSKQILSGLQKQLLPGKGKLLYVKSS